MCLGHCAPKGPDLRSVASRRARVAGGTVFVAALIIGAVVLMGVLPTMSLAANYYVDKNAVGQNNGTSWANAWKSFADISWNTLASGQHTLYISGGPSGKTYNETLQIAHKVSSESNRLTIRPGQEAGHNGVVTISNSNGPGTKMGDELTNSAKFVTINGEYGGQRNIKISGNKYQGIYHRYDGSTNNKYLYLEIGNNGTGSQDHGIELSSRADNTEIAYCSIHDNYRRGIREGYGAADSYGRIRIHHNEIFANKDDGIAIDGGVDVYNNVFSGIGCDPATHPDGIQGVKGYWRIYGNTFHDHTQEVFIETTTTTLSNVLIYNNVFYDSDPSVTSPGVILRAKIPAGNHLWSNIVIANNSFVDMRLPAIRVMADTGVTLQIQGSKIWNNIFYNCSTNIELPNYVYGSSAPNDLLVQNNVFYGNSWAMYRGVSYPSADSFKNNTGSTGNSNMAPLFMSVDGRDYRLRSEDTAARDKGVDLSAYFRTDKDGVLRPQGSGWDIGPYESTGTAGLLSPKNLRLAN